MGPPILSRQMTQPSHTSSSGGRMPPIEVDIYIHTHIYAVALACAQSGWARMPMPVCHAAVSRLAVCARPAHLPQAPTRGSRGCAQRTGGPAASSPLRLPNAGRVPPQRPARGQVRPGQVCCSAEVQDHESHKAAFATSEVTSLESSHAAHARIIRDDTAEPNHKRRGKSQRCAASS